MIGVALIAEDLRSADFVRPACDRLAAEASVELESAGSLTRGSRIKVLKHLVRQAHESGRLTVIAVDAPTGEARRRRGARSRKARQLQDELGEIARTCSLAIADPSVEAWLLADPVAFRDGLEHALGAGFHMPATWPVPTSEREAKDALGRVVHEGLNGGLARHGFEYASEIVRRAELLQSTNESLRHWAKDFADRVRRAKGAAR